MKNRFILFLVGIVGFLNLINNTWLLSALLMLLLFLWYYNKLFIMDNPFKNNEIDDDNTQSSDADAD